MLTIECPGHAGTVDLNAEEIESIEFREERRVLRWRCPSCGYRGVVITRLSEVAHATSALPDAC